MKKQNEASAGILQCKWVFDRQVRDVMEFNWEDEKKKWTEAHDWRKQWENFSFS